MTVARGAAADSGAEVASLRGVVINDSSDAPVQGVQVRVHGAPGVPVLSVLSGPRGRFALAVDRTWAPGRYMVEARSIGYGTRRDTLELPLAPEQQLLVRLRPQHACLLSAGAAG